MKNVRITLKPIEKNDREQFILDNQETFKYGAIEEFGKRDDHFEEEGEIISRKTIEDSMDAQGAQTYRIYEDGKIVGGVILSINRNTHHNELVLFFVSPKVHSRGIGYNAWLEVEKLHPETKVWETCTPYFEKRNLHFYINKCGFHAVEFFNAHHPDLHSPDNNSDGDKGDMMFRFEKVMNIHDLNQ